MSLEGLKLLAFKAVRENQNYWKRRYNLQTEFVGIFYKLIFFLFKGVFKPKMSSKG